MLRDAGHRVAILSRGYGGSFRGDALVVSDGETVLADAAAAGRRAGDAGPGPPGRRGGGGPAARRGGPGGGGALRPARPRARRRLPAPAPRAGPGPRVPRRAGPRRPAHARRAAPRGSRGPRAGRRRSPHPPRGRDRGGARRRSRVGSAPSARSGWRGGVVGWRTLDGGGRRRSGAGLPLRRHRPARSASSATPRPRERRWWDARSSATTTATGRRRSSSSAADARAAGADGPRHHRQGRRPSREGRPRRAGPAAPGPRGGRRPSTTRTDSGDACSRRWGARHEARSDATRSRRGLAAAVSAVVRRLPRRIVLALGRGLGRLWGAFDKRHLRIAADNLRQAFPEWDEDAGAAHRAGGLRPLRHDPLRHPLAGRPNPRGAAGDHRRRGPGGGPGRGGLRPRGGLPDRPLRELGVPGRRVAAPGRSLRGGGPAPRQPGAGPPPRGAAHRPPATPSSTRRGPSPRSCRRSAAGGVVAIVIDQNIQKKDGIFVDFFGRPACTTTVAAALALKTGCMIVPVRCPLGPGRPLPDDLRAAGRVGGQGRAGPMTWPPSPST